MTTGIGRQQSRPAPRATEWSEGMVSCCVRDRVAVLALDRPDKLNAMDASFWQSLVDAIARARASGVRVILITGSGNRAFSAGGDIDCFANLRTHEDRVRFQRDAMAAFAEVETCDIPIVAVVNGLALGGGCELAMACDFVIAAESARFGLPEGRFGLVPGYGVLAAPRRVGVKIAKFMILTGETLSAQEAVQCGLVQRICRDDELQAEAMRLAARIAATSSHAVAGARVLMDKPADDSAIAASIDLVSRLHGTDEAKEATSSFLAQHKRGE